MQGICRIAAPIFAVFAVRPYTSAEIQPAVVELIIVDGVPANLGIGIVPLFLFVISFEKSPRPCRLEELVLILFVFCKTEFLEDDLGVNQT